MTDAADNPNEDRTTLPIPGWRLVKEQEKKDE